MATSRLSTNSYNQEERNKSRPYRRALKGALPPEERLHLFVRRRRVRKKREVDPPLHAIGFNGKRFLGPPVALIFEDIVHRPEDEANENEKERERDGEKGADPVEDGNRGVGAFDHLQM